MEEVTALTDQDTGTPVLTDQDTGTPAPHPPTGTCERSDAVRKAIALASGQQDCQWVMEEQIGRIEAITLEGSLQIPGDLAGMTALRRMKILGLTTPITREHFLETSQLRDLTIRIGKPEHEQERVTTEEGAFRDMPRLESLTIGAVDGWSEQTLGAETLLGLGNLRTLRMDYLKDVAPDAFLHSPGLREISLHGAKREDEFYPKIPREIFASLAGLRKVEIRNFRWPPILEVQNNEVACSATKWVSFKDNPKDGKRPLSVLTVGKYNRPKDVESMLGCGETQ